MSSKPQIDFKKINNQVGTIGGFYIDNNGITDLDKYVEQTTKLLNKLLQEEPRATLAL